MRVSKQSLLDSPSQVRAWLIEPIDERFIALAEAFLEVMDRDFSSPDYDEGW